jgi:hypothetical protein
MQVLNKQIQVFLFLGMIVLIGCAPRFARETERRQTDPVRQSLEILDQLQRQDYKREHFKLFREIRYYLGAPYVFGGEDRRGFDCSGFVMVIFRDVYGIDLPHNASQQHKMSQWIPSGQLKTGDLVFFDNNFSGRIDHVGIYLNEGYFAHASASAGVVVSNLNESYYRSRFQSAGRVLN